MQCGVAAGKPKMNGEAQRKESHVATRLCGSRGLVNKALIG